jgi:hypothetical protein
MAFGDAQIFDRFADLAVLPDQRLHNVVDRRQPFGEFVHRPHIEGVDVVAGFGLRLGRHGNVDLLADRGQEIDLAVHLVLLAPGIDDFLQRRAAGGDPVIPQRQLQFSGGPGGSNMHQRQRSRGGTKLQRSAARDVS